MVEIRLCTRRTANGSMCSRNRALGLSYCKQHEDLNRQREAQDGRKRQREAGHTFITYRFPYRRPTNDGPHGYEGPEYEIHNLEVDLCTAHVGVLGSFLGITNGASLDEEWNGKQALQCDACEAKGQDRGLVAIWMERAGRV